MNIIVPFADVSMRPRWMRSVMNILELLDGYLGIDLSGIQFAVTKHGLNVSDVCSVL